MRELEIDRRYFYLVLLWLALARVLFRHASTDGVSVIAGWSVMGLITTRRRPRVPRAIALALDSRRRWQARIQDALAIDESEEASRIVDHGNERMQ